MTGISSAYPYNVQPNIWSPVVSGRGRFNASEYNPGFAAMTTHGTVNPMATQPMYYDPYLYQMSYYRELKRQEIQQNHLALEAQGVFLKPGIGEPGHGRLESAGIIAGNVVKGIPGFLKSLWNGATKNEHGEFSLWQTAKSLALVAGVTALSILVPPAGLALAGVMGYKYGSHALSDGYHVVKHFIHGDLEEAEEAAYHFGENATGTALALLGARASMNGLKASYANRVAAGQAPEVSGTFNIVKAETAASVKQAFNTIQGLKPEGFTTANVIASTKEAAATLKTKVTGVFDKTNTTTPAPTTPEPMGMGSAIVDKVQTAQEAIRNVRIPESIKSAASTVKESVYKPVAGPAEGTKLANFMLNHPKMGEAIQVVRGIQYRNIANGQAPNLLKDDSHWSVDPRNPANMPEEMKELAAMSNNPFAGSARPDIDMLFAQSGLAPQGMRYPMARF